MLFFWTFYIVDYTKILSSTTVFNIDKQQISISEWFLKDHETLNTGVLKMQLCILGINDILNDIRELT